MMEGFSINKRVFGVPFHLKCLKNGSITRVESEPRDLIGIDSKECYLLSRLYGFEIPKFPPQKYKKTFEGIEKVGGHIPWEHVLPNEVYKTEIKNFINKTREIFDNLDLDYYRKIYQKTSMIFEDIKPAKIDPKLFLELLTSENKNDIHLKSFTPQRKGFAATSQYSRVNSKTGKLTIIKGANILNLRREHRRILVSRFGKENGKIHSLDYAALEPRVLLTIMGEKEDLPKDIYRHVLDELNLDIPREIIKQTILSRIYGAGTSTIIKQLEKLVDYPEDVVRLADDYFGIETLRQKLVSEFNINDGRLIKSFYGRPILCGDTAPYVLLNNYIQSTAVDVALFGFNQINDKIKETNIQDKIIPIFILHDELFLDVHNDFEYLLPKLCRVGSMDIPRFENTNFWLGEKNGK